MQWFTQEIVGLRTGRVRPDIVLHLPVETYGARTTMQNIASVSNSDARTLVISPYDKNTITAVEKAVTEANLGVQPVSEGGVVRLVFPSLTEEIRQQTIKQLHSKAEETRVKLRQARDEALRILKQDKEKSDITEDDFYNGKQELDKLIGQANEDVADTTTKKEEEIKTI